MMFNRYSIQKMKPTACFVPNCTSGKKKSSKEIQFHAPDDPIIVDLWKAQFRKQNFQNPFNEKEDTVCSKHFHPSYISKEESLVISGQRVSIPKRNPTLTEDAVPTIFNFEEVVSSSESGAESGNSKHDEKSNHSRASTPADSEEEEDNGEEGLNTSSHKKVKDAPLKAPAAIKPPGRPRGRKRKKKTTKPTSIMAKSRKISNEDAISKPTEASEIQLRTRRACANNSGIKIAGKSILEESDDEDEEESNDEEAESLNGKSVANQEVRLSPRVNLNQLSVKSYSKFGMEKSTVVNNDQTRTSKIVASTSSQSTMEQARTARRQEKQNPVHVYFLKLGDDGYTLGYIYQMKDRITLPNNWILEMITHFNRKLICIAEIVADDEDLALRRSIKIHEDLSFKVVANGVDLTQMFTETSLCINSLPRLQSMITDFSRFGICEGIAGYSDVSECRAGRRINNIWYSGDCDGVTVATKLCEPCLQLRPSLAVRKSRLTWKQVQTVQIGKANTINLINRLPKDDPLRLQIQIEELEKEKLGLNEDVKRLQASIRQNVRRNKIKTNTMIVKKAANPPQRVKKFGSNTSSSNNNSSVKEMVSQSSSTTSKDLAQVVASMQPTSIVKLPNLSNIPLLLKPRSVISEQSSNVEVETITLC